MLIDMLLWLMDMVSESTEAARPKAAAEGCILLCLGLVADCRNGSSDRDSIDLSNADLRRLVQSSGSFGEGGALVV